MKNTTPYFVQTLKNELERRKRINSHYSLRSFANSLKIDSGVLSAILKNKRKIPKAKIDFFVEKLKLDFIEKEYFLKSLLSNQAYSKSKTKKNNSTINWNLEESLFIEENELTKKILSEWEYYAFLSLLDLANFQNDRNWMATRLGVTPQQIEIIINDLEKIGLIFLESNGNIVKSKKNVFTSNAVESQPLKHSHKESLIQALNKIDSVALENRSYSSMTIAFNSKNMDRARELIKEFRRRFSEILEENQDGTEVFQLAIQFFPLTQMLDKAVSEEK